MNEFVEICKNRGLAVPNGELSIPQFVDLVLSDDRYTVPVFASFKQLALPIVSEWLTGTASSNRKTDVFCRLCLLVPLLPPLQLLMEHFLVMHAPAGYVDIFTDLHSDQLESVLLSVLRLLVHDHGRFSRYFSAEAMRNIANTDNLGIRTIALANLALLMNVSESQMDKWVVEYCGGNSSADFQFGVVFKEAMRKSEDTKLFQSQPAAEPLQNPEYESHLVTNIGGIYVPRIGGVPGASSSQSFVETETSKRNLQNSAQCLLLDRPMLFAGDSGSGKTCLVEYLHQRVRGGDLVRIHLGDQTDAKALVGTYTTGSKPGTFEWTPGALTSAVQQGKWVLIEDIDRAPNEIVAVLISLLESRELVIPSRNQVVKAAPGFQLVATTTAPTTSEIIGSRSWVIINLSLPTTEDLETIILTYKPFLSNLVCSMLVTVYKRVEEWQEHHNHGRSASTRDLMKLIKRINAKYDTENMFREAVACFTSFLPNPWPLIDVIADAMNIAPSTVHPLLERYNPNITLSDSRIVIGRAEVDRRPVTGSAARNLDAELAKTRFTLTQPTLKLLEDISVAVEYSEPVLLVGETGTGKTAVVQHLAKLARRKLVVINVSQQVETGDLIGGFKPVDARQLAGPLLEDFNELFESTFSRAKNYQFIEVMDKVVSKQQWPNVIRLLREAVKMANATAKSASSGGSKRAKTTGTSATEWSQFAQQIDAFEDRVRSVQKTAQFQFIEGLLIRAIRHGHWVLLDELNLAPPDTVEGIGELISSRMLTMLESGGQVVHAHSSFRLFANMNPATDVGKRDLPRAVRAQFTELWAPSPDTDPEALRLIVQRYLPHGSDLVVVNDVAQFYSEARDLGNTHQLADGAGQRPHFSIRTLSRALSTASVIAPTYGLRRALFEAFSMCFLTLLDEPSAERLGELLGKYMLDKLPNRKSVMNQTPKEPTNKGKHISFAHWWMPCGSSGIAADAPEYILTASVERNLLNLVRATATKMFPVLIQGPTSSGKTSMISYLAKRTGHSVVRINNHEHTDLSEYLGGYESDTDGKLVFKEGALVTALRNGHWLVLDELNLAPTDVLEALNRLLDDNRELLVPETQEIIKPHPDFVLFATQNPPGLYAGRKVLSRAFRNRFLELHFGDIPEDELEIIVRDRSGIAPSYAAKIVEVYRELGRRKIQRVFEQAATLRDLFRWAQRPAIGYEQLAFNGYALLGERSRTPQEKLAVKEVIEKVMKVSIDIDISTLASPEVMQAAPPQIIWTRAMKRVLALVLMALERNEPVLLVGETGCGKTTIVQTIASAYNQRLITLNAHQNTETGDLVGSQRPVRSSDTNKLFEWVDGPLVTSLKEGDFFLLDEISLADDSVLERLNSVLEQERTLFVPEIGAVHAQSGFQFLATMNPGGDYGKKELSPALRNRFTEIWVPTVDDEDDLSLIVSERLPTSEFNAVATTAIVTFSRWFSSQFGIVSLRDILSWVEFVNAAGLDPRSVVHGACMVFVDGLGIQSQFMASSELTNRARAKCLSKLTELLGPESTANIDDATITTNGNSEISIGGINIPKINKTTAGTNDSAAFSLQAPTSALNAMRVLRAMQVRKPVLLEGSPGAGKTSLITELAKLCNVPLTRINLSDQTDLSDLFGQDVPLSEPGKFGWRSAPFLRAMEHGEWVLLDEMNLAPQPVLEGLNACLDHRGEAYIPELDRVFPKHPGFTVFAAQNPQAQGGGRKGLPKSFINRFSVVYVEQLGLRDLYAITATTHPTVDADVRNSLCDFMEDLSRWSLARVLRGGPFEFNLRDTLRWLDLVEQTKLPPQTFLGIIVIQRLRTEADKAAVAHMFHSHFTELSQNNFNPVDLTAQSVTIGNTQVPRSPHNFVHTSLNLLPSQIELLETALSCVKQAWPLILVGNSGSGKTSIIRLLAQICGTKLVQFSMTADIDSTDLLGEFDQLERQSELQRLWSYIEECTKDMLTSVEDSILSDSIKNRNLPLVKQLLPDCQSVNEAITTFETTDFSKPIFHWVDGMLVKAVEQGDWLILDNANLCSAAVLDRLNSLLERGGSLAINECANEDGSPRQIKPHPNFRLFLTVNPKYGELSRAMRNRGVEVWVPDNSYMTTEYSEQTAKQLTIAGSLPIYYTRPFANSRLTDMTNRSWLRALVIDHRTPPEYMLDTELAAFATSTSLSTSDFTAIYQYYQQFQIQKCVNNALNSEFDGTIFHLSALRRVRDSVECDFDVYGVVVASLPLIIDGGELGSVISELVLVKDPSRIHVFREWLLENCKNSQFIDTVKHGLGKRYDFSDGGKGMELLWQNFGRKFGFSNEQQYREYTKTHEIAANFDSMVSHLGIQHATSISEIRIVLASLSTADSGVINAIEQFQSVVGDAPKSHPLLLESCFRDLWYSLAIAYTVEPSEKLSTTLAKLTSFAQLHTVQLEGVLNQQTALYVPEIYVPQVLESSLITVLHETKQGQAKPEVDELIRMLSSHSWSVAKSMYPERYIVKMIQKLTHTIESVLPDTKISLRGESVASDCVELAQSLLHLYVCPLPLDPAIAQHVWYERYLKLQQEFKNDQQCWNELQKVFDSKSEQLESWLQNRDLQQESVPSIWRPESSTIAIVHRHMVASAQLANNAAKLDSKSSEEIELVLRNADHLSAQLHRASGYRDLISAVSSALSLLKIGLTLQQRNANTISDGEQSFMFLDPVLVSGSTFACESDEHLLALRSMKCLRQVPKDISVLFDSVYRQWTLERLQIEEQQREQLAGFKYNDDDEDRVEQEFKQMFPDFDEMPEVASMSKNDTFAPDFMHSYCDLFLNSQSDIVETLIKSCESVKHLSGKSDSRHLAALYLALKQRSSSTTEEKSKLFNFYFDSSVSETVTCVKFAEAVRNRVFPLLEMWPEHDTLQTLDRIAKDTLEFPPGSPVALLLSKVEQIMHYLYEWDRFASKDVKLGDLMTECTDIIVRWRRLELSTWPALFEFEKKKAAEGAAPFWFHLYETLVKATMEDLTQTAKVMVIFLSESPIGQFEIRLKLLEAFEQHLLLLESYDVYRCVANVRQYFLQFLPLVRKQQEVTEKKLRKQVDEVVRLASWRDVNVHALKQSAQRSHRALFKHVKKFREVLQSKVVSSFEQPPTFNHDTQPVMPKSSIGAIWKDSWLGPITGTRQWKTRPRHLKDLTNTASMIDSYLVKIGKNVEINQFNSFATDVVKRAQKLRDETPKTWSKEQKKLISALKVEKQQLLTATLRELRNSGLASAVTKKTLENQIELIRVLANTPTLRLKSPALSISDPQFFALIELIPKLRSAVSDAAIEGTCDAPISDLKKALSHTENALYQILRLRRVAWRHSDASNDLNQLCNVMADLATSPKPAAYSLEQARNAVSDIAHVGKQIIQVVDAALQINTGSVHAVLLQSENLSDLDLRTNKPIEWLTRFKDVLSTLSASLHSTEVGGLVASNIDALMDRIETNIQVFKPTALRADYDTTHQSVSDISNAVLVIVQQVMKKVNITIEEESEEEDANWFTNSLKNARQILLSLRFSDMLQRIHSCVQKILTLSVTNKEAAGGLAASVLIFVRGYMALIDTVEGIYGKILESATSGTFKLSSMLFTVAKNGFCSPEPMEDDSDDEDDKQGDGVGLGDGAGQSSTTKDVDEEEDDVSEAMQTANPDQQEKDEADDGEDNAKEMEGEMAGEMEDLPPQDDEEEEDQNDEEEDELEDEIGDIDDLDANAVDEKMWDDNKEEPNDKEKQSDQNVEGSKDQDVEAGDDENKQQQNAGETGEGNQEQDDGEEQDGENGDDQEDGEGDSDVEPQDDIANQGDDQNEDQLDPQVEQKDALELPEDMNFDGDDDEGSDVDEQEEGDDAMDVEPQPEDGPDDPEGAEEDGQDNAQQDQATQQDEEQAEDAEEEEGENSGEAPDQAADEEAGEERDEEGDEASDDEMNEAMGDEGRNEENDAQMPKGDGDGGGADIEGLNDLEDTQSNPNEDQATTTDNKTESQAQGASEDASTEQSNMATGGTSGANQDQPNEEQDQADAKSEQIKESLKQLGDAMKEFHKRQKAIREHQQRDDEEEDQGEKAADTDDKPLTGNEELEHVGAEDAFDTQALGKANSDEHQDIDESMAIEDEQEGAEDEQDVAGDEETGAEHGGNGVADNAEAQHESEPEEDDNEQQPTVGANIDRDDEMDEEEETVSHETSKDVAEANPSEAVDLWQVFEFKTQELALLLGEQLRLILEPTVASKLRGDYRTGKRLNMKRIIPYIASEFRKDKIWLRRSKPAKREYQVMLALDDSKSMGEPAVVDLAFQAIALVGKALGAIEAGQMGIAKFGSQTEILHPLDKQFNAQAGNAIFGKFGFNQQRTNVHHLLESTLDMFAENSGSSEQWKLEIIVSDGITDDHKGLRKLVRRAYDERVMLVFVVLDALNKDTSILDMNEVRYSSDQNGNPKLEVAKYMEDFPFDYYVIVRDITDLPMVLASVLRQYFQAVDM